MLIPNFLLIPNWNVVKNNPVRRYFPLRNIITVGFQFINSTRYSYYMFALLNPDMKFPW